MGSASGSAWSKASSSAGGLFSLPTAPTSPTTRGVADLGCRLLQRHWRKGLASEAAAELLRYGFDVVGLDRVIAQTMTVNARSRAVMERVGLRYRAHVPHLHNRAGEGVEQGEVEYEMTREQWERSTT